MRKRERANINEYTGRVSECVVLGHLGLCVRKGAVLQHWMKQRKRNMQDLLESSTHRAHCGFPGWGIV